MNLAFSTQDIARWAKFSNDFNPIHFDQEAARKAGSSDVIVHGMLAVLPIKESLGQSSETAGAQSGWRLFKSRFKRPVPACRSLAVSLAAKAAGVGFRMGAEIGQTPHIQGQLGPAEAPRLETGEAAEYVLSSPELARKLSDFRWSYPEITQPWVALDALVFSEFLERMLAGVVARADLGIEVPAGLQGLTGAVVVQTSHAIHYDAGRLGGSMPLAAGELRCRVRPAETVQLRNAASGTVLVECLLDGVHAMSVEIGLMIIWPTDAAAQHHI